MNAQDVLTEMEEYVRDAGRPYYQWYAGITSDIDERVYGFHRVTKDTPLAYVEMETDAEARVVEAVLLELGCKGGRSGGDETCRWVYVYLITPQTVED